MIKTENGKVNLKGNIFTLKSEPQERQLTKGLRKYITRLL